MYLDFSPLLYIIFSIIYIPIIIKLIKKKKPIEYHILFLGFYIYILLVLKQVFLPIPIDKMAIATRQKIYGNEPIINLVPFKSIINIISHGASLKQIVYNIFLLIPLGFLLPLVNDKMDSFKKICMVSFIVSMSIELLKLIGSLIIKALYRYADIDDIILNVSGAIIGFELLKLTKMVLHKLDCNISGVKG